MSEENLGIPLLGKRNPKEDKRRLQLEPLTKNLNLQEVRQYLLKHSRNEIDLQWGAIEGTNSLEENLAFAFGLFTQGQPPLERPDYADLVLPGLKDIVEGRASPLAQMNPDRRYSPALPSYIFTHILATPDNDFVDQLLNNLSEPEKKRLLSQIKEAGQKLSQTHGVDPEKQKHLKARFHAFEQAALSYIANIKELSHDIEKSTLETQELLASLRQDLENLRTTKEVNVFSVKLCLPRLNHDELEIATQRLRGESKRKGRRESEQTNYHQSIDFWEKLSKLELPPTNTQTEANLELDSTLGLHELNRAFTTDLWQITRLKEGVDAPVLDKLRLTILRHILAQQEGKEAFEEELQNELFLRGHLEKQPQLLPTIERLEKEFLLKKLNSLWEQRRNLPENIKLSDWSDPIFTIRKAELYTLFKKLQLSGRDLQSEEVAEVGSFELIKLLIISASDLWARYWSEDEEYNKLFQGKADKPLFPFKKVSDEGGSTIEYLVPQTKTVRGQPFRLKELRKVGVYLSTGNELKIPVLLKMDTIEKALGVSSLKPKTALKMGTEVLGTFKNEEVQDLL